MFIGRKFWKLDWANIRTYNYLYKHLDDYYISKLKQENVYKFYDNNLQKISSRELAHRSIKLHNKVYNSALSIGSLANSIICGVYASVLFYIISDKQQIWAILLNGAKVILCAIPFIHGKIPEKIDALSTLILLALLSIAITCLIPLVATVCVRRIGRENPYTIDTQKYEISIIATELECRYKRKIFM